MPDNYDWRDEIPPEALAKMRQQTAAGGQPVILVEPGNRHIAADEGIAALVTANVPFYQRNRKIQRIALIKAKNTRGDIMLVPGIVDVDSAMMARELGRSAIWQRHDMRQNKLVRIDPPGSVGAQILSMVGQWPFPPLNGIVQCPTLRRDGSLLDQEGYDEATGLVLVGNIPMPPSPRRRHGRMLNKPSIFSLISSRSFRLLMTKAEPSLCRC
jgi:hypothetical protein